MALIKLLGVLIVIVGFALKLDSILIVISAAIVTALVGGLGVTGLLETLGTTFVANRSMAIFILIMLVTGTLERNGLRNAAAALIGKVKNASPGKIIGAYGIMRAVFAAFNASFGGVAGFVRPVIMPMLVQSTLEPLGYHVELIDLAKAEIPVAIFAVIVGIVYYYIRDKKLAKKYYGEDIAKIAVEEEK